MRLLCLLILVHFSIANAIGQRKEPPTIPKSYNEFVFPPDINKYPLLFSTFWTNQDHGISESDRNKADQQISKFIEEEKLAGGLNHHHINDIEGKDYSKLDYRYIILTKPLQYTTQTNVPASTGNIPGTSYPKASSQGGGTLYENQITLCFYIKDRQTSQIYAIHGTPPHPIPVYDESQIDPASPSAFFNDLKRILKNLNSQGPEETFKEELRLQTNELKRAKAATITFTTILVGLLGSLYYALNF